MRLRLIRHATLVVEYGGHKLLVDPMLSDAGTQPPIESSPNPRPNPLVALPISADEVLQGVEAVLVTHTHRDHWDAAAAEKIPKSLPILGQPEDQEKVRAQGFTNIHPIKQTQNWNGISITRTGGQHGTGEIGKKMAPVSGFVLETQGEPSFYIAGDTVWCLEVAEAIRAFQPRVTVVNTGAAQFLQGDPITMTAECVITVCRSAPNAQVVAVHMEAINHCLLTRADLAFQLEAARVNQQVSIPNDGDWVELRPTEVRTRSTH
jgi:L-ascorbate metabolism protein UlaG (beta-lactamase superfamily)